MQSTDGKYYNTDVADTEQVLRLVQSIPSKKAEPFKMWLAKVGSERIDETVDPELSIERAIQNYRRLGYSENWINQRIKSIEVRKALTDEWDKSGVEQGEEYAVLTDLMSRTWSGMTTREAPPRIYLLYGSRADFTKAQLWPKKGPMRRKLPVNKSRKALVNPPSAN